MPYEPLHHKYRPQSFADLVGQDAIATTLTNAIRQNRIAPAYLFAGPRGTGKTSSARILAKSLNCLNSTAPTDAPCGKCEVCRAIANGSSLDVIEIDAASNTGVDNIRELIERAQFAPVQCRQKVYIVDECLTGDTQVQTAEGWMRIDNPCLQNQQVLSYNEFSDKWEFKKVLRWLVRGERETLIIKTHSREIRCTANHLIRTEQGWIAAGQVKNGMKILAPSLLHQPIKRTKAANKPSQSSNLSGCFVHMGAGKKLPFPSLTAKNKPGLLLSRNARKNTLAKINFAHFKPSNSTENWQNWKVIDCFLPGDAVKQGTVSMLSKKQGGDRSNFPGKIIERNRDFTQAQSEAIALKDTPTFSSTKIADALRQNGKSIPSLQWVTSLETVESVQRAGCAKVYDIEVERNHNFVANGLLVHNCHMLSTAAFNSLLKTLEEPPDRVVFVLATTDPQRVLPTIISRCQRFDFRRIPLEAMVQHLTDIAAKENIDIAEEAVRTVAQIAQGGLRDAESLLDQLSLLEGQVTVERVWDLVGAVPERDLIQLLHSIAADDGEGVLDNARELMNRGREPLVVLQNLASFYRDLLIAKTAPSRADLVALTPPTWEELCDIAAQEWELGQILAGQQHLRTCEGQIKNTTQPRLWLEVTLLGLLPAAIQAHTEARIVATPKTTTAPKTRSPQTGPVPAASPPPRPATPVPDGGIGESSGGPPKPSPMRPPEAEVGGQDPAATSPPPPGSTASETEESTAPDLEAIWQQVVGRVAMGSTQALLKQHGELIAIAGQQARVGIRSQPLLQMVQKGIDYLQTAFEQVVEGSIHVTLEVTSQMKAKSTTGPKGGENLSGSSGSSGPAVEPPREGSAGRGASPPSATPPVQRVQKAIADRGKPPNPVKKSTLSSSQQTAAPADSREKSGEGDFEETRVAAKRFAEFFNGEVAILPDDWDIARVELTEENEGPASLPAQEAAIAEDTLPWHREEATREASPSMQVREAEVSEEELPKQAEVEQPAERQEREDLSEDPFGGLEF